MRAKIALSAALYHKLLRLDNSALLDASAGQMTNLISVDVARLEMVRELWSDLDDERARAKSTHLSLRGVS